MGRVTLGGATGSGILHRCTIAISRQKGEKHVEHGIYRCSAGRYDERMVGGAVSVEVDVFVGERRDDRAAGRDGQDARAGLLVDFHVGNPESRRPLAATGRAIDSQNRPAPKVLSFLGNRMLI